MRMRRSIRFGSCRHARGAAIRVRAATAVDAAAMAQLVHALGYTIKEAEAADRLRDLRRSDRDMVLVAEAAGGASRVRRAEPRAGLHRARLGSRGSRLSRCHRSRWCPWARVPVARSLQTWLADHDATTMEPAGVERVVHDGRRDPESPAARRRTRFRVASRTVAPAPVDKRVYLTVDSRHARNQDDPGVRAHSRQLQA